MHSVKNILKHLTAALGLVFIVFLILDEFNPMMNFIDNTASRCLLAVLCLSSVVQNLIVCHNPVKSRNSMVKSNKA